MDFATLAAEPQSLRTSSTQETALRSLSWSGLSLASSVFLPEFPHCKFPVQDDFQILGFIAKGSFGPILKVKDRSKEKTFAVKVLPKSEILKHGVLEQSKEERQVSHPFFHNLQDCLQTQRHLFIMCEYCSTGDLYTYWILEGQFGEDEARKRPVQLILQLKNLPDRPVKATRGLSMDYFQNFDCDILHSPTSPTDMSPTLANINLSQALATVQGSSK
ncbi:unnamed protein product [Coregonus sp. 'balchen']|nr:unnamed protein product [Coregonus sp. 'balchen']